MDGSRVTNPHIVGLTGSFGSGCTYVADRILVESKGYRKLSLSDTLRELYEQEKGGKASQDRRNLQQYGDRLRADRGAGYLASEVAKTISVDEGADGQPTKWVVDSIRNPAEIRVLRNLSRNFFLFGIYADRDIRWSRVRARYKDDRRAFDEDDRNDTGEASPEHGQRVGDCFSEADVVLTNDRHIEAVGSADFQRLAGRVEQYVDVVSQPLTRRAPIGNDEATMAMAYAASQRSSCLKRKVGAVIVDDVGNALSSGFNEVPARETPCQERFVACHRDWLSNDFFASLKDRFPDVKGWEDELKVFFRSKFKILDLCRALHAEENAILSLARNGRSVPLDKCTLFTTTYPCRLCANKIVSIGIKKVVYLEPYPDPEAKAILRDNGVSEQFFEGVTFKAYFRVYGEEK